MTKCKVGDRVGFYWWGKFRVGKIEAITGEIISVPNTAIEAWAKPYFWLKESEIHINYSQEEVDRP